MLDLVVSHISRIDRGKLFRGRFVFEPKHHLEKIDFYTSTKPITSFPSRQAIKLVALPNLGQAICISRMVFIFFRQGLRLPAIIPNHRPFSRLTTADAAKRQ